MDKVKSAVKALNDKKVDLNNAEFVWDKRSAEVNKFGISEDDFALRIIKDNINLENCNVLDISFGAGRYMQEFLKQGANISGVELSNKMIEFTKQKLNKLVSKSQSDDKPLQYDDQRLIHSSWERINMAKLNWEKAFDLVFMNQSPAISSLSMLEKVLNASKNLVFISSYTSRQDSLLVELQQEFNIEQTPVGASHSSDMDHIMTILEHKNIKFSCEYETREKINSYNVAYIVDRYASWLFKGEMDNQELMDKLRIMLIDKSDKGTITTTSKDVICHLLIHV